MFIVEDEAMTALFMESMLKKKGLKIVGKVNSGEEALTFVKNLKPDVVILDIRLSGDMTGIDTAKKIREEVDYPVQLIFTTGYGDSEYRSMAEQLQALAFLEKPVNINDIFNLITNCTS
ncbi:MAG TPA: response regulator [Spirochaetota bacterium]|nr:response regulator [Spirochaetota bacterium]